MTKPGADRQGRRRRPQRGHGRIPAEAYTGCEQVIVSHPDLGAGTCCPHCRKGTLYRQGEFAQAIRLKGQVPVVGTRYQLERLRCGLCGRMETAPLPEDAGEQKYDATVASTIAVLRYGEGFPWNRLERIQRAAGIPLPASVQWELVRDAASRGPQAAYAQLLVEAAQGNLIHNDDTGMRVLELMARVKNSQPLREDQPDRTGVFTTSILSLADGRPPIALFIVSFRQACVTPSGGRARMHRSRLRDSGGRPMQARVRDRAGVTLESVEAQFRRWRRARDGYGRIPHELWRAAAEAAAAYGVQETAARLQLDAGKLRRWMRTLRGPVGQPTGPAESAKPAERPQFVELAPLAIAPPECTLEIEDPSGRRLRISLKGQAIGQAAELSQMLWRVQS